MSERIRIALLLVIAALVYGNALLNGFTFDDYVHILSNPTVTNLSVSGLFEPAKANPNLRFFRPVTFATYELNWEYDDALKFLNVAIANSPGYSSAWSNRAAIWYKRGDLESARADAQTALRLDQANSQAQYVLNLLSEPAPSAPQR